MTRLNRDARLMLSATLVSNIGNGIQTLTIGKLLYDSTGSVAAFGFVIVVEYLMLFLANALAGSAADRYPPRRTLVVVDSVRGLLVLAVSLLLYLQSGHQLALLTLVTVAVQVGKPFSKAARFALEPSLMAADQLARYNGLAFSAMQAGQLFGIALAGVVLSYWGAPLAIGLNGLSFLFGAGAYFLVSDEARVELLAPSARRGALAWIATLWHDWRDALQFIGRNRGVGTLLVACAGDYLTPSFLNLFFVLLVALHFGGDPYGLSILDGGFAVGAMLGGLAVDRFIAAHGARRSALLALAGQGAGFVLLATSTAAWMCAALTFFIGTMSALSLTALTTTLQLRVKGPYKGRMGLARSLVAAVLACVLVPLATAVVAHSLALALGVAALVSFSLGLLVVLSPRSFHAPNGAPAQAVLLSQSHSSST
ncbi:MAG TPA: MFS transporter [Burkholderiaceae bacterium]|nr:MFS transporter [Burkholderiaceae bacterium]